MNVNNLINSLIIENENYNSEYYNDCIIYLKKILKDTPMVYEMPNNNDTIISAVKVNIFKNYNNYNFSLNTEFNDNIKQEGIIYRYINLSKKGRCNLFKQICVLETNDINKFATDDYLKYDNMFKNKKIIFIAKLKNITNNKSDNDNNKSIFINDRRIVSIFFGVETFRFLEYQNMKHLIRIFNSNERDKKIATNHYRILLNFQKESDNIIYDRLMIFSGLVFQVLGVSYNKDIDALYLKENNKSDKKIEDILRKYKIFDLKMYEFNNKRGINDFLCNPINNFHFLGIKFMSIYYTIKRTYIRFNPDGVTDLIATNKICNLNIKICYPYISSFESNRVLVLDKNGLINLYDQVIKRLKDWHNIIMTRVDLDKIMYRCNKNDMLHNSIYTSDTVKKNIKMLWIYYLKCIEDTVIKYANKGNLLTHDNNSFCELINVYTNNDIKNIININDDEYVIKRDYEELYDNNINLKNITFLDISKLKKRKEIIKYGPYNNIFLNLVIHNYIDDINNFVKFLGKIQKNSTIIITYFDGNLIKKNISRGSYKLRFEDDMINFGLYKFNDGSNKEKVAITLAGILDYDKGSLQRLVYRYKLINAFHEIGYKPIVDTNLLSYYLDPKYRRGFTKYHNYTLRFFRIIVFKKDSSIKKGGSRDTFYKKYVLSKNDYINL